MAGRSAAEPEGCLANVSAALIVPSGEPAQSQRARMAESARLLQRLFEDILVVVAQGGGVLPFDFSARVIQADPGPRSELADLACALAAAREQRVLVVAAELTGVTADLLLGLTAWPEHVCVAPRMGGVVQPLCALYQREAALGAVRETLERRESSLTALLAHLDCGILEGNDLAPLISRAVTIP